uniref:DUF7950 domain-containing protein n=1 Tax=Ananas comosus var. bracteatus TaxID=296719 RepID=A0A6V7NN24_ANACO|nr:unnamed protein product [Ananas comosus var. bracteatus]
MDRRGGGCCIASPRRVGGRRRLRLRRRRRGAAAAEEGGRGRPRAAAAEEGGRGEEGRRPRRATVEERSSSSSSSAEHTSAIVTLPLMPESPETAKAGGAPAAPDPAPEGIPGWLLRAAAAAAAAARPAEVVVPRPVRPAGSWVTVESVVDTWRDGEAGAARELVRPALDDEEAPVFVSDRWERVTWTNEAYRRMVVGPAKSAGADNDDAGDDDAADDDGEEEEEVRVGLVTKGHVPEWGTCGAFTCRVRVRYACRRKGRGSLAAPCDVWRSDGGCYTWRLDVKAALSLSLCL